ncbi:MAG: YbaY family lipoprotein [Anaerolineae bacterium]|jgi:uncharacterized lipoprotein YbaY|nr:YbaY family lipoprotein [Anaerolineae bacterium]
MQPVTETTPLVQGDIVLPPETPALVGATVRVFLEDVSRLDAPAPLIAEHVEHNVTYSGAALPFKLYGELPHLEHHYSVRVHISLHDGTDILPGDFLSTDSYPVLTHGHGRQLSVKVIRL